MKLFRAELNTTYDLTLTQTSQTHTQIRQVANIQVLQRHTEPLIFFSFFRSFCYFSPNRYQIMKINKQRTEQTKVLKTKQH